MDFTPYFTHEMQQTNISKLYSKNDTYHLSYEYTLQYIGEMPKFLHARIREHMKKEN